MASGEPERPDAAGNRTADSRDVIPEHVTHLRGVQFTLLVTCIVMVVAVYLSLQERRVSAAANQLENFALAFSEEGAKGWEVAIRDQVWDTFEAPGLVGSRAPEVPRDTVVTTWLPKLRVEPPTEAGDTIRLLERERMLTGSGAYLDLVLDLVQLGLPNHSVALSNPNMRGRTDCLGSLRSETPRRVRQLRLFWQNLSELQAATFSEARLKGSYRLLIDLVDERDGQARSYLIHDGRLEFEQKRARTAFDDYAAQVLSVGFVAMRPCMVEPGAIAADIRLGGPAGTVGGQLPLLYYVGEFKLSSLLTDGAPLALRFTLVPKQQNQAVRLFDGRFAMSAWLGGRTGDGSFSATFPELAGIGQREVLVSERANRRAESDAEWAKERDRHFGLERLRFEILETDVPLPPRAEDRIDVLGAKVQVEDVVLWGGVVVVAVQFYLLLHLIGLLDLLESGRRGDLRAPWIGVYRGPLAHCATLTTTVLVPSLICGYLSFRVIERELDLFFVAGGILMTVLSLLVAIVTVRQFHKIWSIT